VDKELNFVTQSSEIWTPLAGLLNVNAVCLQFPKVGFPGATLFTILKIN
jgi:hypothetical protein